jgi:sugar lactone lactonase YvrE
MNTSEPRSLWEAQATLGEGVLWHAASNHVYFVDIKGRRIYRCAPDGRERRSWDTPQQVSFIVPVQGGGFVVGMEDGLYRFAEATGALTLLRHVEADLPGNRFNDGYVDACGRLWFGSMDNGEQAATGALYRFDGAAAPQQADTGYIITNGPATSPDGRTLYHTDTRGRRTYAFDLAPDGSVSGKREFASFHDAPGHPDGMAVDAEGCVWIAVFRGRRIDRFAPDGRKIDSVRFPCSNITKLAFGGDDLRTVYVTTARKGLSPEELSAQPLAGALFTFRAQAPGLPQHALRLRERNRA